RELTMPQVIEPSAGPKRKVVVVGGGPAGLEAARVSAERGHDVVLFEAAPELGGQIVIAAKAGWRKDLIGIRDWYADELERLGVDIRSGVYAEAGDVMAEAPDVVIVAAGGVPDTATAEGAERHAVSTWDILAGAVPLGDSVLVYDDNGQHPGPSCADFLADRGATVELVTPDRMAAAEMGGLNWTVYLEHFYAKGVRLTPDTRLVRVEPDGNRFKATLRNAYSDTEETRLVDQVVIEHGTLPMDDVFMALRSQSVNDGVTDVEALAAARPQRMPDGDGFVLWRVGDAAASRNIHAAIYESLRLCKDL
ncbi:MAG: FAD-dependent oxidoreductase, partial [Rhodospirillaceae bacterium]